MITQTSISLLFLCTFAADQYQSPQMPYVELYPRMMCKNHGHVNSGELSVPDTKILTNPTNSVLGCAQAVQYERYSNQCSDVFFANAHQCTCLRPGQICKRDESKTGFSVYKLTSMPSFGPVLSQPQSTHIHGYDSEVECENFRNQVDCSAQTSCR